MCVIIAKPADKSVSKDTLEKCWYINDDGAGIAWVEDGVLKIKKGFMSYENLISFWDSRSWDGIPMLIHFRISTSGKVDKKNTHPFWVVNDDLVFAHNGVFMELGKDNISDTIVFNREVLQRLPDDFIYSEPIMKMIGKYCGFSSKLAFLNASGEFSFVNEKDGKWDTDGCWYSNFNHKFRWVVKDDESLINSVYDNPWSDTHSRYKHKVEMYNVSGETVDQIDVDSIFDEDVMIEILGHDAWYCHDCNYQFTVVEVMDVQVERDGLVLPKCPCCGHADNVFCYDTVEDRDDE